MNHIPTLTKVSCPACDSEDTQEFYYLKKPKDIGLHYCNKCYLIYKSKDSENMIINVNEGDYYSLKKIGSKVNDRYIKHFNRRAKDHYAHIESYLPKNSNKCALDIGCGAGLFIAHLKSKGWQVNGIEPDPLMYNHAKNVMGLDVEQTTFDVWKQDKKYGLIYLSHVLDDLPNINQVIEKITEHLEPNGILFIEVPNFSWSFRMNFEKKEDLYINKYFFSIASLTSLLTNNNFKILNTKTFQLVHRNTFFQKLISHIMLLMKLKPKKYRPYLRIISRKNV